MSLLSIGKDYLDIAICRILGNRPTSRNFCKCSFSRNRAFCGLSRTNFPKKGFRACALTIQLMTLSTTVSVSFCGACGGAFHGVFGGEAICKQEVSMSFTLYFDSRTSVKGIWNSFQNMPNSERKANLSYLLPKIYFSKIQLPHGVKKQGYN